MSVLKNHKQFLMKLPSMQTLSTSTRACGSGSYCNPQDNKQTYIKIQDFELPETALNVKIDESAKRNKKLEPNSRRDQRRQNVLTDNTTYHPLTKRANEEKDKNDGYLYKSIFNKISKAAKRAASIEVRKYIDTSNEISQPSVSPTLKINKGIYLFKPEGKRRRSLDILPSTQRKRENYFFDCKNKSQYMFKIQTLKDEKTTSHPEKEKDIFRFEKKDIKEFMFKVKSDINKNSIKKEDDKKPLTVEPIVINKSDFIFKPKTDEIPIQKPKEIKKLRLSKVQNNVDETSKNLQLKQDKANQDKFKKEVVKTSNVIPQRESKRFCSLFLCKFSSLY